RILGIVGVDVPDTMLYLSRIFYHMGKRVLMTDYSESKALYYSIPLVPGTDVYSMRIEYRDTFFTCGAITEQELQEFDVVMIFFGFAWRKELDLCSHLIYTTDFEKNHLEKLAELKKKGTVYTQLVYRNVGKDRYLQRRKPFFSTEIREECQYYCNDSSKEKRLRRQCQYNDSYGFRGISSGFRKYLSETVRAVFPDEAGERGFAECFRRAEMGV
ncbi:MAG: hypothetical protein IJY09_09190, partial [Lachnospiraceae bacterium]|nr:hypothetical protein [Lachnospiraceae bacterium]